MPERDASLHLAAAAALYGVSAADLEKLGAFESDVYAFGGPHGPSILKVISPDHRSAEQVQAEVDWLLALADAGVRVAQPLPSLDDVWVERLDEPEMVLVAFARSAGKTTVPADWTPARIEGWGAMLGQLQAHSRAYRPPGPRRRRITQHTYLKDISATVPDDPAFTAAAAELEAMAEPLLRDGRDNGLIHADLHHGNLLLDGESWTAIDFDDAAYGPYAFDLAMPLYYCVRAQTEQPPDEAAEFFLAPFLRGFREHADAPQTGAEEIALYLRRRDAELVMALRLKLPDEQWSDRLRATEARLRKHVAERREVVSLRTLRRFF